MVTGLAPGFEIRSVRFLTENAVRFQGLCFWRGCEVHLARLCAVAFHDVSVTHPRRRSSHFRRPRRPNSSGRPAATGSRHLLWWAARPRRPRLSIIEVAPILAPILAVANFKCRQLTAVRDGNFTSMPIKPSNDTHHLFVRMLAHVSLPRWCFHAQRANRQ